MMRGGGRHWGSGWVKCATQDLEFGGACVFGVVCPRAELFNFHIARNTQVYEQRERRRRVSRDTMLFCGLWPHAWHLQVREFLTLKVSNQRPGKIYMGAWREDTTNTFSSAWRAADKITSLCYDSNGNRKDDPLSLSIRPLRYAWLMVMSRDKLPRELLPNKCIA
jgi:hypothetical protein